MEKHLKALIVDDSEEDALLVAMELKRSGYDIVYERADTPESFTAALDGSVWDVVLCDYVMPRFSGPAALEILHGEGLDIPFIIVSGKIGEDTAVAAMKAGAHDYIMKDRLSRLAPAIDRELAEAVTRRERRRAEEKVARLSRLYSVLYGINEMIVRARDRQDLFDDACRIAVEKGLFLMAWVGLVDQEKQIVRPVAYSGNEDGYLDKIRISTDDVPEGRGPTGYAVRYNTTSVFNDIEHNLGMLPWKDESLKRGFRSVAAFPLVAEGRVEGAFTVYAIEPDFFDEDEVALLNELAADISFAMQNIDQEEKRKKTELALQESEKKFRLLVEDSLVGVYIVVDNVLVYANPRLAEIFGFTPEDMMGLSVLDLTIPEEREPAVDKMSSILSGKDASRRYQMSAVHKDGSPLEIELLGIATVYDGKPALIGTLMDITERRRAEDAVAAEVAVTKALLEASAITSANFNWEEVVEKILSLLSKLLGSKSTGMIMLGGDGYLQPLKATGATDELISFFLSLRASVEEIPALAEIAKTRKTLTVAPNEMTSSVPEQYANALDLKALIITPIISREKVVGFLGFNFEQIPSDPRVMEIIKGVTSQLGVAYENFSLYADSEKKSLDLARKMEALKVLAELDRMILSTLNRDEMLSRVVFLIRRLVPADLGFVALHEEDGFTLRYGYGWGLDMKKNDALPLEDCAGSQCIKSRKSIVRTDMWGEPSRTMLDDKLAGLGVRSDIYVPILSKGAGTGFLCLGSYRVAGFTMEDVQNAENLSNQISIALENTKLLTDLEDMFVNVVKTLASAIDAKSPWTKGHSERVTKYAVMIAEKMNIEPAEIEKLRLGGFLHDIGKIGTFDVILDKPGKLTAEEFELVKKHPAKGEEILSPIKQFKDIIPVVLYHHERWDGTGYPEGLKGEKIPLLARILCVADSYDSMTADRPYRSSPGIEYAVSEFRNCSGTQFDPKVVEVFVEILGEKKKAA